jgi:hypothetical protein
MLFYRPFEETDMEGILELWETYSGWGGITEQQFRDWYINTPNGPCLTVVATNEAGRIVGQKVFIPRKFYQNGQCQMAFRVVAPILSDEIRLPSLIDLRHPVQAMFKCAMQEAISRGFKMIYAFPASGWSLWMKAFYRFKLPSWSLSTYRCFKIEIGQQPQFQDKGHTGMRVNEVDQLKDDWEEIGPSIALNETETGFIKSKAWVNWKYGNDRIFCFYREGKMEGYLVLKNGTHLIQDGNARSKTGFNSMFTFLLNYLRNQPGHFPGPKVLTISGMLTPFWESMLKGVNYSLVDYSFVFGMFPLHEEPGKQSFSTEQWNVFPGD